jgi:hypothetical protein
LDRRQIIAAANMLEVSYKELQSYLDEMSSVFKND